MIMVEEEEEEEGKLSFINITYLESICRHVSETDLLDLVVK